MNLRKECRDGIRKAAIPPGGLWNPWGWLTLPTSSKKMTGLEKDSNYPVAPKAWGCSIRVYPLVATLGLMQNLDESSIGGTDR